MIKASPPSSDASESSSQTSPVNVLLPGVKLKSDPGSAPRLWNPSLQHFPPIRARSPLCYICFVDSSKRLNTALPPCRSKLELTLLINMKEILVTGSSGIFPSMRSWTQGSSRFLGWRLKDIPILTFSALANNGGKIYYTLVFLVIGRFQRCDYFRTKIKMMVIPWDWKFQCVYTSRFYWCILIQ